MPLSSPSFHRIVVATDLSPGADVAVEQAAHLAKQWKASLTLLHVFNDGLWQTLQHSYDMQAWGGDAGRLATQKRVEQLAEFLEERFQIDVQSEFLSGKAAEEISQYIDREGADLLLVGEHGENWIGETVMGGTALKVLNQTKIPVLLARRPVSTSYTNLIVATDFSDTAFRAAQLALRLFPKTLSTFLNAYYVQFEGRMRLAGASEADIERFREDERRHAESAMQAFMERLGFSDEDRPFCRLSHAFAASAIFELATQTGADLIVIGKHQGHPLEERLLGSVTQNVLYHASCDVLLVP